MQLSSKISFLVGNSEIISQLLDTSALTPFNDLVIDFFDDLSKVLIGKREYSDVVTFAFWIRRANLKKFSEQFHHKNQLGRGIVFHIAPSNVPVNFAYSLAAGLLMGNVNIVRVPSKDFRQVSIITSAINKTLEKYQPLKNFIICVRYEHDKEINDLFSSICYMRIIWGGDKTIAELRQSPLQPRSSEITFADRYSLAVIDSDVYLATEDKTRLANDFYNDTFFSDQNACTSPRLVIWTGNHINEAKKLFWRKEHELVREKYSFQPIMAVNKLTRAYIDATKFQNQIKIKPAEDNLIIRVDISNPALLVKNDFENNSGFFYECDVEKSNLFTELKSICNDKRCQTIGYIGDKELFSEFFKAGLKGIDRIVPIGHTMDFDLIWDGYNLPSLLTRNITIW